MVATVRCEEIANEKLSQLTSDEVKVSDNKFFLIFLERVYLSTYQLFCFSDEVKVANVLPVLFLHSELVGTGCCCSSWSRTRLWKET
jgi:hypothetical protein